MQACSKQAKARAFTALVRPHLETCSPVWSPHQSGTQEELEKVQRSAARWIRAKWDKVNHRWSKTYEECRSCLSWTTVRQRHLLLSCCQAFNHFDCLHFDDYFSFNSSPTRSHRLTLRCARSRINSYRYSF